MEIIAYGKKLLLLVVCCMPWHLMYRLIEFCTSWHLMCALIVCSAAQFGEKVIAIIVDNIAICDRDIINKSCRESTCLVIKENARRLLIILKCLFLTSNIQTETIIKKYKK